MRLLTKEITTKLLRNGEPANRDKDHKPVVKFFGGSSCTWLITEMGYDEPKAPAWLFGLCDLGQGYPELGYVSLDELESIKFPPFGLGVERDRYFKADKTLSQYHNEAIEAHRIIA